ncbi:1-phosphatidylinositol 4,5-bisphosphate phosphodiesterase beta-4 [Elasticomyces elasticus]|nr:1-phosphatidylinositol 4,5-bisphosphate phosphodiesterase beta-4 [Elasticomyces elasticus]
MTSFSEPILRHLKAIHEELGETSRPSGPVSFDKFLGDVTSPAYDATAPLVCDESYPISNYFISSSHNTYLSGNQLYGRASTDAYKNVLTRGCRCVEIDVWDGEDDSSSSTSSDDEQAEGDHKGSRFKKLRGRFKRELGLGAKGKPKVDSRADSPPTDASEYKMPTPWRSQSRRTEPVVLHGHTATREVPFRQVCETIGRYAFQITDLPLIVSLEIHTSPEQQRIMVEIMKDLWKDCLVDRSPSDELNTPLPSLASLRRKILIKVKYSPPQATSAKTKHGARMESAAQQASARVSSDEETQLETKQKKSSIIDALSSMGVYTRACHFKNFDQPGKRPASQHISRDYYAEHADLYHRSYDPYACVRLVGEEAQRDTRARSFSAVSTQQSEFDRLRLS